jgi:chitinase
VVKWLGRKRVESAKKPWFKRGGDELKEGTNRYAAGKNRQKAEGHTSGSSSCSAGKVAEQEAIQRIIKEMNCKKRYSELRKALQNRCSRAAKVK